MTIRFPAAVAAFLLIASGKALALKEQVDLTPKNVDGQGFAVALEPGDGERVRVTITRDLSRARSFPAESPLEIRRRSTLRIHGDPGLLVECPLEAEQETHALVYRFTVARDLLARTHVSIAEIDDYKDATLEHLLGGGTFYEIRLAEFLDR